MLTQDFFTRRMLFLSPNQQCQGTHTQTALAYRRVIRRI